MGFLPRTCLACSFLGITNHSCRVVGINDKHRFTLHFVKQWLTCAWQHMRLCSCVTSTSLNSYNKNLVSNLNGWEIQININPTGRLPWFSGCVHMTFMPVCWDHWQVKIHIAVGESKTRNDPLAPDFRVRCAPDIGSHCTGPRA